MQTNGAIFDLMLGIPQGEAAGIQPPQPFGSTEPALSFEQLLARLALPGAPVSVNKQAPFSEQLPSTTARMGALEGLGLNATTVSDESAPVAPKQPFSLLAEMFAAANDATELNPDIADEPALQTRPVASEADFHDLPAFDDLTEMAKDAPPLDESRVRDFLAIQSRPVAISEARSNTLGEGTYEILAVAENGKSVEFTLKSLDPTAEPIRLSLPLETAKRIIEQAAQQQTAKAAVIPARVAIQQSGQPSGEITALLQKLNLKELTVRSADQADTNSETGDSISDKQKIEFHGQPDGKRVVFDLTVPRRSLTVRTPMKAANPEMMTQPEVPDALASKTAARTVLPEQAVNGKVAEPTSWPTRPFTGFEFKNHTAEAKGGGDQWLQSLTSLRTGNESSTVTLSQQLQTARFTLPENIANQYKGNGRSITIGIEPEQLGPARLHLSVTNHSLTARLTVESSAARSIVEQSLEQLTQQLDRAGIKVDSITVQVAGGNTNTNMFEQRQQAAFNRTRMNRRMTERIISQEMNGTTPTPRPSRPSYIGAGGVNVFA